MKWPIKLGILVLLLLSAACLWLGAVAHQVPASVKHMGEPSMPQLFFDGSERIGEITDYAICGEYLYLLYGNKSILDCYSITGVYSHSYFMDLGEKGSAKLFVKDDVLCVKSRDRTFYYFSDGMYRSSERIGSHDYYDFIADWEDRAVKTEEYSFERQGASIWKMSDTEAQIAVRRSAWLSVFQGPYLLMIGPLCAIAAILLLRVCKVPR